MQPKATCPGAPGSIVIDSKFPLESYLAVRDAETDDARKVALAIANSPLVKTAKAILRF